MHGVLQFNDSFHMWSDILLVVMVKKCQAATVGLFRHNLGFISECVSVYFPARPSFFLNLCFSRFVYPIQIQANVGSMWKEQVLSVFWLDVVNDD